jgi:hypothetical protein
MAVPVAALAKIAAAALSDEDTRRKLGWIVAAICSPLILTLALICSPAARSITIPLFCSAFMVEIFRPKRLRNMLLTSKICAAASRCWTTPSPPTMA